MCLLSGLWRRTQCQFLVSSFCQSGQRLWLLFSGSLKKTNWIKDLKADLSCNGALTSFFRGLRISRVPFTYMHEPVSSSANEACANVLIGVSPSWGGPMISTWLFHSLLPLIWCFRAKVLTDTTTLQYLYKCCQENFVLRSGRPPGNGVLCSLLCPPLDEGRTILYTDL